MLSSFDSSVVVKEAVVFCRTEEYACTDTPIAEDCKAESARSSEAFTEVSSFDSSILPATIEALICCPVSVKSISAVSLTVTGA